MSTIGELINERVVELKQDLKTLHGRESTYFKLGYCLYITFMIAFVAGLLLGIIYFKSDGNECYVPKMYLDLNSWIRFSFVVELLFTIFQFITHLPTIVIFKNRDSGIEAMAIYDIIMKKLDTPRMMISAIFNSVAIIMLWCLDAECANQNPVMWVTTLVLVIINCVSFGMRMVKTLGVIAKTEKKKE
jgi:hypothetical protein